MLQEAMQFLSEQAIRADRGPRHFKEADGPTSLAIMQTDGSVSHVKKPIPARGHSVLDLESLCLAARRFGLVEDGDKEAQASLWVSWGKVLLLCSDDGHCEDRVTLPVVIHPAMNVLESTASRWLEQKALIDLIRHDLAGCRIDPPSLLPAIRKLKFASVNEQTGEFSNTSAAMGKSVAAQVTGEADLPEIVAVEFHPFPGLPAVNVNVTVFCTLFTDPLAGKLRLTPQPGQVDEAKRKALQELSSHLDNMLNDEQDQPNIPVLLGTP